jgi:DNA-binding transcriptional LysR family regulator
LDQHRPERFATRRQRSMQASLGYVERTRDVGRLQGCISAALPDVNSLPSLDLGPPRQDHIWTLEGPDGAQAIIHHRPRLVSDDMIALRSAAIAGVGVVHLPLLMVSDEIRNGQLVHLLPSWAPKRQVVHAVYPSKRGLLPSVRALLDYLGARFSELRED